ncbi:type I-F CRISPR-associated endoribonuclease Cas6/Csy4 [Vibrio harveyi]|uniref:type I-F CRISPR-associated endoribonuclease Cas6/Csy4 n=1 Tax=Vibrio harveyi TaxID=669 RepID=UPI003CF67109
MSQKRFYLDLVFRSHESKQHVMVSKIVSVFHGYMNAETESHVALGFPKWQPHCEFEKTRFGDTVRLVGDRVDLQILSNNAVYNKLADEGLLNISAIKVVPEEDCAEVRFIRNRTIEKMYAQKRAREIKRFLPHFSIKGCKGKQLFTMHVGMEKAEERIDGSYTTYGFSKRDGATFPLF